MTKLRVVVFSVLLLMPFAALEARLFWMQIVDAEEFRSRGAWTREWVEVVPTPRGNIFARSGEVLASEERCFDVDVVLADFELPRVKGRDPELDYARLARVMRDTLGLAGAGAGFDERQCATMLRERAYPVKTLLGADGGTLVVPDTEAIGAMLRSGGVLPRPEPAQMYVKAVRELKAVDRAAHARCNVPGKPPVSARDRRWILQQEWRQPFRLWQGLTYDQMSDIAIDESSFPGIEIRARTKRVYSAGRAACQAVGSVGLMGEEEYQDFERAGVFRVEVGLSLSDDNLAFRKEKAEEKDPAKRRQTWPHRVNRALAGKISDAEYERLEFRGAFYGDWVGRTGIERWYEDVLGGERGFERRAKNLLTKREWIVDRVAPVPGKDVTLTLDMPLQRKAESLLDSLPLALRGSIVVMDVATGDVLVLASAPGYDANWLIPPMGKEEMDLLYDPAMAPLLNRAISGRYPLGSIFKVVTGAAGLESGKVTAADLFICRGRYDPVRWPNKFACWINSHGGAHGNLDLRQGMARSCNCFFFETGNRAGIDAIAEMANRFGLGRKSGIDLPSEAAGQIPTPAWRRATGRGRWGFADTLNVSIGQGEMLVTPLQAARLMAGLAAGKLPLPRMRLDAEVRFEDLKLKPETLAALRKGLEAVTMEDFGTARSSGLLLFKAAGKTSTAQSSSRRVSEGGRENHGWFAGYAPFDNPKYAFCVMIEEGGAGSGLPAKTAARLLHSIWPAVELPGDVLEPAGPTSNYDNTPSPAPRDETRDEVEPGGEAPDGPAPGQEPPR
ncbi:MAG: penicillin-binding protein [Planctomycetota bacterium]|nr:MAG: penicillin-binding protein [Planctomycetota bacterium]